MSKSSFSQFFKRRPARKDDSKDLFMYLVESEDVVNESCISDQLDVRQWEDEIAVSEVSKEGSKVHLMTYCDGYVLGVCELISLAQCGVLGVDIKWTFRVKWIQVGKVKLTEVLSAINLIICYPMMQISANLIDKLMKRYKKLANSSSSRKVGRLSSVRNDRASDPMEMGDQFLKLTQGGYETSTETGVSSRRSLSVKDRRSGKPDAFVSQSITRSASEIQKFTGRPYLLVNENKNRPVSVVSESANRLSSAVDQPIDPVSVINQSIDPFSVINPFADRQISVVNSSTDRSTSVANPLTYSEFNQFSRREECTHNQPINFSLSDEDQSNLIDLQELFATTSTSNASQSTNVADHEFDQSVDIRDEGIDSLWDSISSELHLLASQLELEVIWDKNLEGSSSGRINSPLNHILSDPRSQSYGRSADRRSVSIEGSHLTGIDRNSSSGNRILSNVRLDNVRSDSRYSSAVGRSRSFNVISTTTSESAEESAHNVLRLTGMSSIVSMQSNVSASASTNMSQPTMAISGIRSQLDGRSSTDYYCSLTNSSQSTDISANVSVQTSNILSIENQPPLVNHQSYEITSQSSQVTPYDRIQSFVRSSSIRSQMADISSAESVNSSASREDTVLAISQSVNAPAIVRIPPVNPSSVLYRLQTANAGNQATNVLPTLAYASGARSNTTVLLTDEISERKVFMLSGLGMSHLERIRSSEAFLYVANLSFNRILSFSVIKSIAPSERENPTRLVDPRWVRIECETLDQFDLQLPLDIVTSFLEKRVSLGKSDDGRSSLWLLDGRYQASNLYQLMIENGERAMRNESQQQMSQNVNITGDTNMTALQGEDETMASWNRPIPNSTSSDAVNSSNRSLGDSRSMAHTGELDGWASGLTEVYSDESSTILVTERERSPPTSRHVNTRSHSNNSTNTEILRISLNVAHKKNQGGASSGKMHSNETTPVIKVAKINNCSICFENPADSVIYTCGHAFMCWNCAIKVKNGPNPLCPLCRTIITDIIKPYWS